MKKVAGIALSVLVVITSLSLPAYASQPKHYQYLAAATKSSLFNPDTIVTLDGTIISQTKVMPRGGGKLQVHALLKTKDGDISIDMGPAWFIDNQAVQLRGQDSVKVTGSRILVEGRSVIVAQKIERGDLTLELRDAKGNPVWQAWKGFHQ